MDKMFRQLDALIRMCTVLIIESIQHPFDLGLFVNNEGRCEVYIHERLHSRLKTKKNREDGIK